MSERYFLRNDGIFLILQGGDPPEGATEFPTLAEFEEAKPIAPKPPNPKGAADQALDSTTAEFQIFYWMREAGFSNLVVATMRSDINTNLSDSDRWARSCAMCAAGLDAAFDAIWAVAEDDPNKPANAEATVEAWRDTFGLRGA